MKTKIIFMLMLLSIVSTSVNAQTDSSAIKKSSFWLHTSGFLFGAYRVEFEQSLDKNFMNGIGIMPIYYSFDYGYGTSNTPGKENFMMSGGGVDVSFRKYLRINNKLNRLGYVKAGMGYSHVNYKFKEYGWIDYIDNFGSSATKYSLNSYKQTTNRVDAFVYFGMRADLNIGFFVDGYFGVIAKTSNVKTTFTENVDTGIDKLGQSFNGVLPRLGLSLGFYF